MYYFFILSNFKPVIIGHTWQEDARRLPLTLIWVIYKVGLHVRWKYRGWAANAMRKIKR